MATLYDLIFSKWNKILLKDHSKIGHMKRFRTQTTIFSISKVFYTIFMVHCIRLSDSIPLHLLVTFNALREIMTQSFSRSKYVRTKTGIGESGYLISVCVTEVSKCEGFECMKKLKKKICYSLLSTFVRQKQQSIRMSKLSMDTILFGISAMEFNLIEMIVLWNWN